VWGTLIALLDDGVPVLGVLDQPIARERWVGVAGQPTTLNGATTSQDVLCAAPDCMGQCSQHGPVCEDARLPQLLGVVFGARRLCWWPVSRLHRACVDITPQRCVQPVSEHGARRPHAPPLALGIDARAAHRHRLMSML
jgi:Inositol monophosphatase family